jgi:hypothetical protein
MENPKQAKITCADVVTVTAPVNVFEDMPDSLKETNSESWKPAVFEKMRRSDAAVCRRKSTTDNERVQAR